MKLCLDTNAYAAFKRGHKELVELLESADEILLPTVVAGELYFGFFQGNKTKENLKELGQFLELPGVTLAEVTLDVAERYGRLVERLKKHGTPLPTNDVWIAATTFETGARLVSYDQHFQKIPDLVVYAP